MREMRFAFSARGFADDPAIFLSSLKRIQDRRVEPVECDHIKNPTLWSGF
jgi:hypothetical protein